MGTMGLGRRIVNGRSLDPSPPAITTAFIMRPPFVQITSGVTCVYERKCKDGVAMPRRPICSATFIVQHHGREPQAQVGANVFSPIAQTPMLYKPTYKAMVVCLFSRQTLFILFL